MTLVLAVLLASQLDRQELIRLTRHYERVVGTQRHDITFVEPGQIAQYPWCAYSGNYLSRRGAWIEYDLLCTQVDMKDMTLHEVCHEKLGHHKPKLAKLLDVDPLVRGLMEQEVATCVAKYR